MSEGLTMKEFTLSDVDQTLMELKAMRSEMKGPYWDAALMDAVKLIRQQKAEIAMLKEEAMSWRRTAEKVMEEAKCQQ